MEYNLNEVISDNNVHPPVGMGIESESEDLSYLTPNYVRTSSLVFQAIIIAVLHHQLLF